MEPVYAGASLRGVNGCVVVPGREWVAFEFHIEEQLLPKVERLDALVAILPPQPLRRRAGEESAPVS